MIRIRYEDFSAGTHDLAGLYGRAERGARGVTVYLLPGLTTWQRKAVIRRLRQEASRGFGPPLPQPRLAIALGLDRVRTTARMARAIIRLHPAATLVPGAFVMAVMTMFVVVSADGLGVAPRAQSGLAELAAVGGSTVRATAARPGRARVPQVTVAVGADSSGSGGMSDSGGTGLGAGSGQRTPARQQALQKTRALRKLVRPVASYACPQAVTTPVPWSSAPVPTAPAAPLMTPVSRSWAGQLACRRPGSRPLPYTAHRPGPRDFAR